ncbi:hypothetical protein QE152_g4606 [Popillia japonica]|uniref:Uncharacterized protein n=1 Tax=Popillia japonica TaxID=7064 RepID=A0AAW1MUP7_POPJA
MTIFDCKSLKTHSTLFNLILPANYIKNSERFYTTVEPTVEHMITEQICHTILQGFNLQICILHEINAHLKVCYSRIFILTSVVCFMNILLKYMV